MGDVMFYLHSGRTNLSLYKHSTEHYAENSCASGDFKIMVPHATRHTKSKIKTKTFSLHSHLFSPKIEIHESNLLSDFLNLFSV
jgi:hypothetical protein